MMMKEVVVRIEVLLVIKVINGYEGDIGCDGGGMS